MQSPKISNNLVLPKDLYIQKEKDKVNKNINLLRVNQGLSVLIFNRLLLFKWTALLFNGFDLIVISSLSVALRVESRVVRK